MRTAENLLTPFRWELTQSAPDTVTTVVEADAPIFAGHYPGRPVVPGVCLIELVGQAAARLGFTRLSPALIVDRARFTDSVLPGDRLTVRVSSPDADQVVAVVQHERGVACQIRLRVGEAAAS